MQNSEIKELHNIRINRCWRSYWLLEAMGTHRCVLCSFTGNIHHNKHDTQHGNCLFCVKYSNPWHASLCVCEHRNKKHIKCLRNLEWCINSVEIILWILRFFSIQSFSDEGPGYWNKFNDVSRDEMTEEQRLLYYLLRTYDKSSRPVIKASTAVVIRLGITLTQILDVVNRFPLHLDFTLL